MRRTVAVSVWAFTIFIGIAATGVVWFGSPPGERMIARIARPLLSTTLGTDVSFGSLETNVFSRLEIGNLTVGGGEDADTLFAADRILVAFSPLALIDRILHIRRIDISGVRADVTRDSTGTINIPERFLYRDGGSSGFGVTIDEVFLTDAFLRYLDRRISFDSQLYGLTFNAVGEGAGKSRLTVAADSLSLDTPRGRSVISGMAFTGVIGDGRIAVDSLTTRGPLMRASGEFRYAAGADTLLAAEMGVLGGFDGFYAMLGGVMSSHYIPGGGTFAGGFAVAVLPDSVVYSGTAAVDSVRFGTLPVYHAGLTLTGAGSRINASADSILVPGGVLSGTLGIGMPDGRLIIDAGIKTRAVSLDRIMRTFIPEADLPQGAIAGSARLKLTYGEQSEIALQLSASSGSIGYGNARFSPAAIQVDYRDGFMRGSLKSVDASLDFRGSATVDSIDMAVTGNVSTLGPLSDFLGIPMTGDGSLESRVLGSPGAPDIRIDFTATNGSFFTFPVDTAEGRLRFGPGGTGIETLHAAADRTDDLQALAKIIEIDGLSGGYSYDCTVSGPFTAVTGEIDATLARPSWRDVVFESGRARLGLDGSLLRIESAELSRDALAVDISGTSDIPLGTLDCDFSLRPEANSPADSTGGEIRPDGSGHFKVSRADSLEWFVAATADSLTLSALGNVYPALGGLSGMGWVVAGGVMGPSRIIGKADISINALHYKKAQCDSLAVTLTADSREVRLKDAMFKLNGTVLRGEGTIAAIPGGVPPFGIHSSSPVNGTIAAESVSLESFASFFPGNVAPSGKGSLDLSWSGTVASPRFMGSVTVDDALISRADGSVAVSGITVRSAMYDSLFIIDRFDGMIMGTPLSISGDISLGSFPRLGVDISGMLGAENVLAATGTIEPDSLDIAVHVDSLDMSRLQPFTAFLLDLRGVADADVLIQGSPLDPRVTGDITLSRIFFKTPFFNRPVTDGIVNARFDRSIVNVDTLRFRSHEGEITGGGSFAIRNGTVTDIDLHSAMHDIKVDMPGKYIFMVDRGDFSYTSSSSGPLLSGDVTLAEGTVEYDIKAASLIPKKQPVAPKRSSAPGLLDQTRLSVRVVNDRPVLLDNSFAHVDLDTNVELTGTLAKPNIIGRISTNDGYILYLDRRFQITRGILDFIDPNRINPYIDVVAVTNIQQIQTFAGETYAINLSVTGPLDDAAVVVTSSPILPRADVFSLLTFGATTDQLTGTKSSSQDKSTGTVVTERLTELSGRFASNYISRKASSLLGIKGLLIEGNLFGASGADNTKASDQLTEELQSDYSTEVGSMNERGIRIRYDLSRLFSVEGYTNQSGRSGLDIEYSVSFK